MTPEDENVLLKIKLQQLEQRIRHLNTVIDRWEQVYEQQRDNYRDLLDKQLTWTKQIREQIHP